MQACDNSNGVTTEVPTLPTTIPAAILARLAACIIGKPLARQAAIKDITVSPAPVTSYTSLLLAGICSTKPVLVIIVMPLEPWVIIIVSIKLFLSSCLALAIIMSWLLHMPTTFSNSCRLGVITFAPA